MDFEEHGNMFYEAEKVVLEKTEKPPHHFRIVEGAWEAPTIV